MKSGKTIVLVLVSTLAALIGGERQCLGEDWPQFLKDSRHSSRSTGTIRFPLRVLWKLELGGYRAYSILAKGTLYVAMMEKLFAYDAETGEQLWCATLPDTICSTPLYYEDILYVGSQDYSLYALDTTGNILWKFKTDYPVNSSAIGDKGKIFFGSYDGFLYALDYYRGDLLWKQQIGEKTTGGGIVSSPIVHNDIVYIASKEGILYAFEVHSAKLIWKYDCQYPIESSPVFDEGAIFITSNDGNVYAFEAITGEKIFQSQIGPTDGSQTNPPITSSPVVADNAVLVTPLEVEAKLYALNKSNGDLLWQYTTRQSLGYTTCVVCGDILIVPFFKPQIGVDDSPPEGGICALRLSTREKVWQYNIYGADTSEGIEDIESSPIVADGRLYVKLGKFMYCFSSEW